MSPLRFADFPALQAHLRARVTTDAIIAIDGLPCSGKSTLARQLCENLGWECLAIDDFTRPSAQWRTGAQPAFPFPFLRHEELAACIRDLRQQGMCAYHAMDWRTNDLSHLETRVFRSERPLLIEGVSTLAPELCPLYDLRIFVESDRATAFESIFERDGFEWEQTWRTIVMPSDDLYFATAPETRADLIVAGRGA